MTLDLSLPGSQYPALVTIFDDSYSILHFLAGVVVGGMDRTLATGMTLVYSGYQLAQVNSGESLEYAAGDFMEFGLGMIIGGQYAKKG